MSVSNKKLFKLMIDRNLEKKYVRKLASIGNSMMTKLADNENVTMEVIAKICLALDCGVNDIVEFLSDEKEESK
ncbi:Cro/C1-type HTH DNA-binding domain protein [anaerobic digester metagenome]